MGIRASVVSGRPGTTSSPDARRIRPMAAHRLNKQQNQKQKEDTKHMKREIETHAQRLEGRLQAMRKRRNLAGLTLLELVVVLTVLVALAGILLPTLPNLLRQSHAAVCSTNIPELNKAMTQFAFLNRTQPNAFDLLADGSGDLDGLPDGGVDLAPNLVADTLTTGDVDALADVGITLGVVADWDESPTFGAHTGAPITLSDGDNVLRADAGHIQEVLGVGTGGSERFIVFGVGQQSSIVGEMNGGIFEAPVHFDDKGNTPDVAYSRYVVVYQTADAAGDALSSARFVGASALHDDGLENVNDHIEDFYD